MKPKLIYCAGGNKRFAEIAITSGLLYGSQLPRDKPHFPIYFADQDWKKPNRENYMRQVSLFRPKMATVKDLEHYTQFNTVLSWAEEVSQYCDYIVIIPKVQTLVKKIPRRINNKDVVLGYSVPTSYGGTNIPLKDFSGREIHLLGGSPHRQIAIWNEMRNFSDIFSIDGNYTQMLAIRFNKFWTNGDALYAKNRWLPRLDEADGVTWTKDAPYEAFRRSCENIVKVWSELTV